MEKKVLTKRELEERKQKRKTIISRVVACVVIGIMILTTAYALFIK